MLPKTAIEELAKIVGENDIIHDSRILEVYSTDASPFYGKACAVVRPESEAEVSKILKLANSSNFPVVVRGSGSGTAGGAVPNNSVVVDMKKMDRIEVFPEDMIVYCEAGAILYNIKKELERHDLFIPPEPGSVKIATIGGFVANNGSGKRGLKYGGIRNYIVGMNVVLPDGKIVRMPAKTHRTPGMTHQLFVGSEGTLGIITGIYLRAIPLPEKKQTFLLSFKDSDEMFNEARKILKYLPDAVEYIDEEISSLMGLSKTHTIAVEVFGKNKDLERLLQSKSCEVLEDKEEKRFWEKRETVGVEIAKPGKRIYAGEDFAVPFSEVSKFIQEIKKAGMKYEAKLFIYGHLDSMNIHPAIISDDFKQALSLANELYRIAMKFNATIGEHGIAMRWGFSVNKEIYRRLKYCLDQKNVLNPGKFGI